MDRRHGRLQTDVLRRAVAGEHDDFAVLFGSQLALRFENIERIAHALGTGIGNFFGGRTQARESASLVRKSERLPIVRGGSAFGYDYESLAHQRLAKRMDPFIFTFPSKIDRHVYFEHEGEEFVFVLSGKVVFQVGDQRWTLQEGDSLYFDAAVPHRGWSEGREARALVVMHSGGAEQRPAPRKRKRKRS